MGAGSHYENLGEIRVVLHPGRCIRHATMDPHWVEVYSGLSFVEWHPNLFQHVRKGGGRR